MPNQIFLSYNSPSREQVEKVRVALESRAWDCWMDRKKLFPGDDWELEIEKALDESKLMILFLTPGCDESPHVKKEFEAAERLKIPILPIRLAEYRSAKAPLNRLDKWQFLDAFEKDIDTYTELILTSVRRKLGESQKEAGDLPSSVARTPVHIVGDLVYDSWIRGFLHPTIASLVLKEEHSEGLDRPYSFYNPSGGLVERKVYRSELLRRSSGKLLISGDRGSGKTVMMLQIVSDILPVDGRIEDTTTPLVLDVGTWVDPLVSATQQPKILHWVRQTLAAKYQINSKVADQLIKDHSFVYCFDRLDELTQDHGDEQATDRDLAFRRELIDVFCRELKELADSGVEIILTGGDAVEEALRKSGLRFYTARIDPWAVEELVGYLERRGMKGLARFLNKYPEVAKRLSTNFSELQMLASTMQDESEIEALEDIASSQGIDEFFRAAYDRNLKKRYRLYHEESQRDPKSDSDPKKSDSRDLAPVSFEDLRINAPSFASYLGHTGRGEVFALDTIQPTEVPPELQKTYLTYFGLIVGFGVFLTAGIPSFATIIADWLLSGSSFLHAFGFATLSLAGFVVVGLILAAGYRYTKGFTLGAVVGLAFAIGRALDSGLSASSSGYQPGWDAAWHHGLVTLIAFVPLFGATYWKMNDDPLQIVTIEQWEPDTGKILYWIAAAVGLCLLFWAAGLGWYRGVAFGVFVGVFFWARFGKKPRTAPIRLRPNQAILYSRDNAIAHAVVITIIGSITTGICYGIAVSLREGILDSVIALSGLLLVFFFGGVPVAKHIALRISLRKAGLIPPKMERWFDIAGKVGLMRNVGGGFAFPSEAARSHYSKRLDPRLAKLAWGETRQESHEKARPK